MATTDQRVEQQSRWPADDGLLVTAATAGDRLAFEKLIRTYGPALHRYVRRMTRDHAAAEDIVQETFVAAWRQIGTFRHESSLRTWLFAICARKVVDSHRTRRAVPIDDRLIEPADSAPASDPFIVASNAEFLDTLETALEELPARQRAVWILREIEELTFPQIATILNLSPDGARGHHHRARATLQQRLQRWR